ncbi:MAG: hypothetical protein FK731_11685 [Asgard group archaeon]|nr:hypothetical protein [Asgard group archaeon]
MADLQINKDIEKEMRQVLSTPFFGLKELLEILSVQLLVVPPEERENYEYFIKLWVNEEGKLQQQQLINIIIDIAEKYVGLADLMGTYDTLIQDLNDEFTKELKQAQTRFVTKDVPEGFGWSEGTSPTERMKWMKYHQFPGLYSREERRLIQPHPEQDYADPDLLKREWEEGKVLGLGPVIPSSLPKLNELSDVDQLDLRQLMEKQILDAVTPPAHTAKEKALPREERRNIGMVPYPFVCEMVLNYLYLYNHPDEFAQAEADGICDRTRFGFTNENILVSRMFPLMTIEDLYFYWNSIVNEKRLPWVDENRAVARYGGGAFGENIRPLYHKWIDKTDIINNQINWPEDLEWVDRVSPSEAQQWEY